MVVLCYCGVKRDASWWVRSVLREGMMKWSVEAVGLSGNMPKFYHHLFHITDNDLWCKADARAFPPAFSAGLSAALGGSVLYGPLPLSEGLIFRHLMRVLMFHHSTIIIQLFINLMRLSPAVIRYRTRPSILPPGRAPPPPMISPHFPVERSDV